MSFDPEQFRIEHLGAEPEHIEHFRGFDHSGGDGYDFMEASELNPPRWTSRSSWGRDGWDLGDWPYVIVQMRKDRDTWLVRVRVEGDLDTWRYTTHETAIAKVDHIAWFYWLAHPSRYSEEHMTPEVMGADVDRFRGPFSWKRLNGHPAAEIAGEPIEEAGS